ncbi:hypothetical protein GWI33_019976 [Rhynchophorus ferrugineus]|uniref:Uncharacterized protein n=1 Tax=Rhynchophorus ferrugineus TaxID=354439 RepID=A0A834HQB8_RHYFE|nr:hypothetical protein GWI33_019976 [Rhynchophorus ferrugineus]
MGRLRSNGSPRSDNLRIITRRSLSSSSEPGVNKKNDGHGFNLREDLVRSCRRRHPLAKRPGHKKCMEVRHLGDTTRAQASSRDPSPAPPGRNGRDLLSIKYLRTSASITIEAGGRDVSIHLQPPQTGGEKNKIPVIVAGRLDNRRPGSRLPILAAN